MLRFCFILVLCGSCFGMDGYTRRARDRVIVARMLESLRKERAALARDRAANARMNPRKVKRVVKPRLVGEQRLHRDRLERKKFLRKVSSHPAVDPGRDEFAAYKAKLRSGWKPRCEFAEWRGSTYVRREKKEEKNKVDDIELDNALRGMFNRGRVERKPVVDDIGDEDE